MLFKKNNDYWKKRKTHGRPKAIKSPQQLWEIACDYFQRCDDTPWQRTDYKGKENEKVQIPTATPYLWEGLDDFLFEKGVLVKLDDYRYNKEQRYSDFAGIITRIGKVITSQKLEGAIVGAYNANIVARYEGLADKKEIENNGVAKIEISTNKIEILPEHITSDVLE